MNQKFIGLFSFIFMTFSLTSCMPPSTDNVTIDTNYDMNYTYFNSLGGTYYDFYWPTLSLKNDSNSAATITISYSFYVFNIRQTAPSLNKTISIYVSQGESEWTMSRNEYMAVRSDASYNGNLIDVGDVDFAWTVNAVSASS
jgi:hypothetical protein